MESTETNTYQNWIEPIIPKALKPPSDTINSNTRLEIITRQEALTQTIRNWRQNSPTSNPSTHFQNNKSCNYTKHSFCNQIQRLALCSMYNFLIIKFTNPHIWLWSHANPSQISALFPTKDHQITLNIIH